MKECVHALNCGGCQYQGVPYNEQLRIKETRIKEILTEKNIKCRELDNIEGAPCIYSYRNKMDYTFGDEFIKGPMTLGMHKRKHYMSIVTTDKCQIVPDDFNKILRATLEFATEMGYSSYHKKRHEGLLRHLVVRMGVNTGELLVNIVTTTQEYFDEESFTEKIKTLDTANKIVGILRTIHDGIADFIYVDHLKILWGQDYYTENMLGLRFKVSFNAFFQTNIKAVERLYSHAVDLMSKRHNKTILDVYCGTGTISLAVSQYVKKVFGIEIVKESVESAVENSVINDIKNCEFIQGDAFEVMNSININPDFLIVDPPRSGLHPKAVRKIIEYNLNEIIYISCNPKTFGENLESFGYAGYRLEYLKPYDNFPFTGHTELLSKITKYKK